MLAVVSASAAMASQSGRSERNAASSASSTSHQRRPPSISAGGSVPNAQPAVAADRRGSSNATTSATEARGVRMAMLRRPSATSTRSGSGPVMPSCTSRPSRGAASPASSTACAVPTLGWPANGTSFCGLNMRTR